MIYSTLKTSLKMRKCMSYFQLLVLLFRDEVVIVKYLVIQTSSKYNPVDTGRKLSVHKTFRSFCKTHVIFNSSSMASYHL